jgi:hypothetical protein
LHLRSRLTYANVMVTLLAFVVLGGGGAYAATQLGKNSVGTKQLKNGAVTGAKVKDGSLGAGDFKAGQLPAGPKGDTGPMGPTGPAGAPGSPGAALGYAHIEHGELDAAHSKGVVAIKEGVFTGGSHTPTTLCFDLSVSPANVVISPQIGFNSGGAHPAEYVAATLRVEGPHGGAAGCPEGFRDAEVEAFAFEDSVPIGFYVLFN